MITRESVVGAYPVKRLSEVAEFLDSRRRPVREAERRSGPYPYFGANGQQGWIDGYIFEEPLVLLAEDGGHFDDPTKGIAYRIAGKTWVNNHAHVLRPRPGTDGAYLSRLLENYDVTPFVTGTTRGKLTQAGAAEIPIPLPPLPEQRRIAELLDRADALRDKRREGIAQIDNLVQSIFLDMFGDPATNPMGWPFVKIGDFVRAFQGGKSFQPADGKAQTERRVLKISAVTSMRFKPEESKPISNDYRPSRDHFVRPGDLLFSRANTSDLVGAVALVDACPPNLLLPDKLWRFVWRDPTIVEPIFVWALFQAASVRHTLSKQATGTGGSMKNISQEKLKRMEVILPPVTIQREFARRINRAEQTRSKQSNHLSQLDALFSAFQYHAFRGKL